MMAYNIFSFILMPIYLLIPAVILYFVVKLAVKHAVKELKNDGII